MESIGGSNLPQKPQPIRCELLNKTLIIARFELLRLMFSRLGICAIAAFLLFWFVINHYAISHFVAGVNAQDEALLTLQLETFKASTGIDLSGLLSWQSIEFAVIFYVALVVMPLFCIVVNADQTTSDRSRGSLKLISMRATRDQILLGRFLAHTAVQAILILTLCLYVLVTISSEHLSVYRLVLQALEAFVTLLVVVLPFIAMMAFFSALARSTKQALIMVFFLWLAVKVLLIPINTYFPALNLIEFVLPAVQVPELLKTKGWQIFSPALLLAQSAAWLAASYVLMRWKAL